MEDARAQTLNLTEDTLGALVAFVTPGDDAYSAHQGDAAARPGGIAAGATPVLIANLDRYVRASALGTFGASVPASAGVAALLNHYAVQANPVALGPFPTHFARLRRAEKADVFRRWEADPAWEGTEVRAISAVLIGYTAFLSWSEAGVFDPARRAPSSRPVGWANSRYDGPAEGWRELKGYYQGRRKVRGGATRIYRMNFPPLILHIQSSMRMGSNPADSVLDRNAESRSQRAPPRRSSPATSAAIRGSAERLRSRRSTTA